MTAPRPAAVVVLAAGVGTRMRSRTPKVLHRIGGRSLLGHVLAVVGELRPARTLVVIGAAQDAVSAELAARAPQAQPVVQAAPRGTGHALRTALDAVPEISGTVLVVPGDAPLLTAASLDRLLALHLERKAAVTLLTAEPPDPTGYGRVRRDGGAVLGVVEHRDADPAALAIGEVATSVYAFDAGALRGQLPQLRAANAQGEEYVTDAVELLVRAGQVATAYAVPDWRETVGVNDRRQLAEAGALLRGRVLDELMLAGVTVVDPASTWVESDVRVDPDVTLLPGTRLEGRTSVESGAVIGPDTTLLDCRIGAGARVRSSTCEGAEVGPGASVGPYTFLRPGSRLAAESKVGAYVEVKSALVGPGAKVPHLSYVGDAEIGARTNVGAGTIFVNYDGQDKHRTRVGEDVRLGSDTMLVAPLAVGDGAYTAAGSVLTEDVPAGALGIGRARQRNIEGWVQRRRPGSRSAEAAQRSVGGTQP